MLRFDAMTVPRELVETIVRASIVTGVSPVYLMALADKESSFDTDVGADTSTAVGLFQFIEKTWLQSVKAFGPRFGLADEAKAIDIVDGEPVVADAERRRKILDLRRDPYISAIMAAEMAKRDRKVLAEQAGRDLTFSESYLAHFLGLLKAGRFMELLNDKPKYSARREFPAAARANRAIFFKRHGRRRKDMSVAEVFGKIDGMIHKRVTRYSNLIDAVGPISAFAAGSAPQPLGIRASLSN
jgi:hypothetical protein